LIFSFYYFWRMHIWMHEIWFSFVLLSLNNAYMNAWNLILFCFVIFEEFIYECMKFYFFFIIFEKWIYECMKFDFLLFCYFWRMHIWMHEILLLFFCFIIFYFERKCMFDCLIFYFWFSWTIMHILNEWNSIFHFLFSWMIMHEILFSWIIIFDTNVCTKFFKWFYKWFFEWTFQR